MTTKIGNKKSVCKKSTRKSAHFSLPTLERKSEERKKKCSLDDKLNK